MLVTRNRGFTLIELMITLVLALVVLGGVMGVFISTYQANSQNIKAIRLNEEMRAVMSLISRDIRRAGTNGLAWQPSRLGWPNSFSTATTWTVTKMTGAPSNSCVTFAYDLFYTVTNTYATDPRNFFGYRLNATGNGVMETYNHNAGQWSCNGTGWQPVTDPNIAWIQSLVFTVTNESGSPNLAVRTVIVTLKAATNTRSTTPSAVTAADCSKVDVVCRQLVEKIRIRNDASF
jgi:type IV pilus assembly protein PilW